jgi:hypothetical protein
MNLLEAQLHGLIEAGSGRRVRRHAGADAPCGDAHRGRIAAPRRAGVLHRVAGLDVKLAVPEKALVDTLYLRPARTKLFRALPVRRNFHNEANEQKYSMTEQSG